MTLRYSFNILVPMQSYLSERPCLRAQQTKAEFFKALTPRPSLQCLEFGYLLGYFHLKIIGCQSPTAHHVKAVPKYYTSPSIHLLPMSFGSLLITVRILVLTFNKLLFGLVTRSHPECSYRPEIDLNVQGLIH